MIAVGFVFASALGKFDAHERAAFEQTLVQLDRLAVPHAMVSRLGCHGAQREAQAIGYTGSVLSDDAGDGDSPTGTDPLSRLPAAVGFPPDRIFCVGVDPDVDIEPARRAGMQTVWLRRVGDFPPQLPAPDHTITSMPELLEVLSGPYTRALLGMRYVLNSVTAKPPSY